jgi:modulator of FtsH protease
MGLIFVAVSINLSRIVETPGLSGRAAESLLQFLQVFFVCTAMLIPRQAATAVAIEILAVGLLSWAMQVATQIFYAKVRKGHPLFWLMARIVQTQLATVPFFIAGIFLLLGRPAGLYWLVPGFVFSFAGGVGNAWVLLIEIVR